MSFCLLSLSFGKSGEGQSRPVPSAFTPPKKFDVSLGCAQQHYHIGATGPVHLYKHYHFQGCLSTSNHWERKWSKTVLSFIGCVFRDFVTQLTQRSSMCCTSEENSL
eukprot:3464889-Amphidinium_carterae.1